MSGEKTNSNVDTRFSLVRLFWSLRPVNIFIVVLTQILFYKFLFQDYSNAHQLPLALSGHLFPFFILTTAIITMCGYLINDYMDYEGDILNAKQYKLANKFQYLPPYFIFGFVGLALSYYVAVQLNKVELTYYYLLASSLLFFYSIDLKRRPVIGNILVALFTAFVLLVFALFEFDFLKTIRVNNTDAFNSITHYLYFYGSFMFLLSFYRELVKDLEDLKGDKALGLKTLAVLNQTATKNVANFCLGILILFIILYLMKIENISTLILAIVLLIVPQVWLFIKTYKLKFTTEYALLSKQSKINMFLGLLYFLIINLI